MKKIAKRFWAYLGGANGLIMVLYAFLAFGTYVFVSKSQTSVKFAFRWLFIVLILCFAVCPLILKLFSKIEISSSSSGEKTEKQKIKKFLLIIFSITLIELIAYFLIFYPGGFWGDQMGQYKQAVNNVYDDWHPAIHTLIFYKIPLLLFFNWVGAIPLFQILIFSLVITYTVYVLLLYFNKKVAIIFLCFVLLNPSTGIMAIQAYKDTAFAIFALLLTAIALQIIFSKGIWLKKPIHIISLIFAVALTTLLRHNAALFTVPYVFALVFYMSPKRSIITIVSVIMVVFAIKVPLYMAFNVSSPGKRQVEMLGVPMCIIGAAVTYNPDALDNDVLTFAYEVAPKEVWEETYTYGDFNSVKWDSRTNVNVIENYGIQKVVGLMFKCIKNAPIESINGFIRATDPVYTVTDDFSYYETVGIAANEFGIEEKGIPILKNVVNAYLGTTMMMFPHLFMYIGSMMMLLICTILAKCKLNKKEFWKKIFFALPVLFYNFGTMFLLTGASDSSRFFYYTFLTCPLLIIMFFRKEKNVESMEEIQ